MKKLSSSRKGRSPLYTAVILILAVLAWWQKQQEGKNSAPPPPASVETRGELSAWEGRCVRVIDGDTVDVEVTGGKRYRIRVLGIDTAETHNELKAKRQAKNWKLSVNQVFGLGEEAKTAVQQQLQGKAVRLLFPGSTPEIDDYDRTLAYLECGGIDPAIELLQQGLAEARRDAHPRKSEYQRLAAEARNAKRGLYRKWEKR